MVKVNVFVHDDRTVGPDGQVLVDKSPATVADLVKLTAWLAREPRAVQGPTIWLLGGELAGRFGWLEQPEDVEATANAVYESVLAAFQQVDPSAIVEKRSYRFRVCKSWARREEVIAEVVVARLAMITDGSRGVIDGLVSDDPEAEIVRRINWVTEHFKIDAAGPAAHLAAQVAERTWSPLPPEGRWPLRDSEMTATMFEPVSQWHTDETLPRGGKLAVTDQRRAVLAEMGTAVFGLGDPERVRNARGLGWADKQPPQAAARITLPALNYLGVHPSLAVHPAQRLDEEVTTWVCTRTIQTMLAPAEDGGLGMDSDDLEITTAHVWPQASQKLATWAKRMREAIDDAGGDESLDPLFKEMYSRYYTWLSSQYAKGTASWQPIFSGTIRAGMRARSLRFNAKVYADTGLRPVAARSDAWIYRVTNKKQLDALTDPSGANGKYRVKEVVEHTPSVWARLTGQAARSRR